MGTGGDGADRLLLRVDLGREADHVGVEVGACITGNGHLDGGVVARLVVADHEPERLEEGPELVVGGVEEVGVEQGQLVEEPHRGSFVELDRLELDSDGAPPDGSSLDERRADASHRVADKVARGRVLGHDPAGEFWEHLCWVSRAGRQVTALALGLAGALGNGPNRQWHLCR